MTEAIYVSVFTCFLMSGSSPFGEGYRTPIHKLFGDGIPLQCFHPEHNACMPDCRDVSQPCEFEDDFVHIENLIPEKKTTAVYPLSVRA